jgi:hypothetical protein
VVLNLSKTTSSEAVGKVYTVIGYKDTSMFRELKLRDEGFLAFFEPTTTNPREACEKAISYTCENISIHFTGGDDHYEKVVKLIKREVAWRWSAWGNRAPIIPLGKVTIWTIVGSTDHYDAKGKPIYHDIYTNWDSTTPGDDIERAIELGATHIILEVKQWKHGSERPKPRKLTQEEFFTGKTES